MISFFNCQVWAVQTRWSFYLHARWKKYEAQTTVDNDTDDNIRLVYCLSAMRILMGIDHCFFVVSITVTSGCNEWLIFYLVATKNRFSTYMRHFVQSLLRWKSTAFNCRFMIWLLKCIHALYSLTISQTNFDLFALVFVRKSVQMTHSNGWICFRIHGNCTIVPIWLQNVYNAQWIIRELVPCSPHESRFILTTQWTGCTAIYLFSLSTWDLNF